MIQPMGPSAAPRTASRTTAFLYLPIKAPTAPQTSVSTIAQIHNFGLVNACVHSVSSVIDWSGSAESMFDSALKSQAMADQAPVFASASSMRLSARSRPARYTV